VEVRRSISANLFMPNSQVQPGVRGRAAAEAVVIVPRAVVEAGQNAALFAGLHELLDQVGLVRAVGHGVGRVLARPQAVAGHVFGGQHRVFMPQSRATEIH